MFLKFPIMQRLIFKRINRFLNIEEPKQQNKYLFKSFLNIKYTVLRHILK